MVGRAIIRFEAQAQVTLPELTSRVCGETAMLGELAFPRRLRIAIQQNSEVVLVGLLGVLFVVGGIVAACRQWDPVAWSVLIGVGGSLIAASLTTFFSPLSRDLYKKFVGLSVDDVYPSRDDIPKRMWCGFLRSARKRCLLLGTANNNWCRDPDFAPTLLERLRSNVRVQILFLDPNGHAIKTRGKEDKGRNTDKATRESIKEMWEIRGKLDKEPDSQGRLELRVYDHTPSSGMTWVDDSFMIVTHYLAGFANLTSPALKVKPVETKPGERDLYRTYEENSNAILEGSTLITPENVSKYLPKEVSPSE